MEYKVPPIHGISFVPEWDMNTRYKKVPAVLLLAKDKDLAESIRIYMEDSYRVYFISDPADLDACIRKYNIDLLLTDLDKSSPDLFQKLESVRSDYPQLRIMVMYMFLDEDEYREKLILKEADDHIFKPFSASVLKYKLDRLCAHTLLSRS